MRSGKSWKLGMVALLFAAATTAQAAPGDAPPPGSTSVFAQWMRPGSPSKPVPTNKPVVRPPSKPAEDPLVKARRRELENWLRRTDVCVRLMQVADETNDEALRKKAEELDRRARQTYERRMAELNGEVVDEHLLKDSSKKSDNSAGLFSLFRGKGNTKEGGSQ